MKPQDILNDGTKTEVEERVLSSILITRDHQLFLNIVQEIVQTEGAMETIFMRDKA